MKKLLIIFYLSIIILTNKINAFDIVSNPTNEQSGLKYNFGANGYYSTITQANSNSCFYYGNNWYYYSIYNFYSGSLLSNNNNLTTCTNPTYNIYKYDQNNFELNNFNISIFDTYINIPPTTDINYNKTTNFNILDKNKNFKMNIGNQFFRSDGFITNIGITSFFINDSLLIEYDGTNLKYYNFNSDYTQKTLLQTLPKLNGFIGPKNQNGLPLFFEDLILYGIDEPKDVFIYQGTDNNIKFWTIDNSYFGNISDGLNSKILGKFLTPLSENSFLIAGQIANSGATLKWQGIGNFLYSKSGSIRNDLILDKITVFQNPNLYLKNNLGTVYKWDLKCLNVPFNSCQLDIGENKFYCTDSSGNKDPNNIICGTEILPPYYPPEEGTNQTPPEDYIAVYNRETDKEDKRKGNCLYSIVDSDFFTKPIQFCRVDDYIEIKENRLYNEIFCPAGSKFYFNGIVGYGQYYIVNGLCATRNDKSGIVNMKINDLTVQPYATYKSIVPFSTLWTSGSLSGSTTITNQSIVQTYGNEFNLDNSWKNDLLLSSFPLLKQNESIMLNVSSNSDSNDVGFNFIYYTDLNYYLNSSIVSGCSFIDSFIKFQECSSNMINSKTRLIDLSSGNYIGDYTNATGSTIDNLFIENPPNLLNQFPDSIGTEKDIEIFNCNFNNLSWYEYIGSPFLCLFQIAENIYNKGVLMVQNVSYFLQQLFNIGADKTDTKNIFSFLFIEKTHAETGFLNIADGLGDVYNGNGIGGKIGFILRYFIYSLIFLMVIVLFLTYKKK